MGGMVMGMLGEHQATQRGDLQAQGAPGYPAWRPSSSGSTRLPSVETFKLGERQATQRRDLQPQQPLLPHGHLWQNLGRKPDLYPDLPCESDLSGARS